MKHQNLIYKIPEIPSLLSANGWDYVICAMHCGPADTYRGAIRNTITYRLTGRSIQAKPLAAGESGLFEEKKGPCGHVQEKSGLFEEKKGPCGHVQGKSGLFEEKKGPCGHVHRSSGLLKIIRGWTGSPFEQSEHLPGQISLKIATNPMSIVKKSFLKKKIGSLLYWTPHSYQHMLGSM